jgi:hypothetical protein
MEDREALFFQKLHQDHHFNRDERDKYITFLCQLVLGEEKTSPSALNCLVFRDDLLERMIILLMSSPNVLSTMNSLLFMLFHLCLQEGPNSIDSFERIVMSTMENWKNQTFLERYLSDWFIQCGVCRLTSLGLSKPTSNIIWKGLVLRLQKYGSYQAIASASVEARSFRHEEKGKLIEIILDLLMKMTSPVDRLKEFEELISDYFHHGPQHTNSIVRQIIKANRLIHRNLSAECFCQFLYNLLQKEIISTYELPMDELCAFFQGQPFQGRRRAKSDGDGDGGEERRKNEGEQSTSRFQGRNLPSHSNNFAILCSPNRDDVDGKNNDNRLILHNKGSSSTRSGLLQPHQNIQNNQNKGLIIVPNQFNLHTTPAPLLSIVQNTSQIPPQSTKPHSSLSTGLLLPYHHLDSSQRGKFIQRMRQKPSGLIVQVGTRYYDTHDCVICQDPKYFEYVQNSQVFVWERFLIALERKLLKYIAVERYQSSSLHVVCIANGKKSFTLNSIPVPQPEFFQILYDFGFMSSVIGMNFFLFKKVKKKGLFSKFL